MAAEPKARVICVFMLLDRGLPQMLTLLPLVGCIAAGNCAIIKVPSDKYSPASSAAMAHLIQKYLDPDYFAVAEGGRDARV